MLRGARDTLRARRRDIAVFVELHPTLWPALGVTRERIEAGAGAARPLPRAERGRRRPLAPRRGCASSSLFMTMRILLATEGIEEAGGVDTYLASVACGLVSRGHAIAVLHQNAPAREAGVPWPSVDRFGLRELGTGPALPSAADAWRPDLCFSHNMSALEIEKELVERWPVVKMMHGYLGTCVSGQKSFGFPRREPCDRRFGAQCLAMVLSAALRPPESSRDDARIQVGARSAGALRPLSSSRRRERAHAARVRPERPARPRAPCRPPVRAIEPRLRRFHGWSAPITSSSWGA